MSRRPMSATGSGSAGSAEGRVTHALVAVVTLVLPRGATRDRYRREFLAELHGLSRRRRVRYLLGLTLHAVQLRAALRATSRSLWEEVAGPRPRRPWPCRLRIHRWRWVGAEDGGRYEACRRCRRERPVYGSASTRKFLGGSGI